MKGKFHVSFLVIIKSAIFLVANPLHYIKVTQRRFFVLMFIHSETLYKWTIPVIDQAFSVNAWVGV